MSPASEVFSTLELLIEVLSFLGPGDLDRARKVDGTWRTIVDKTPALQRIRCVSPLRMEDMRTTTEAKLEREDPAWLRVWPYKSQGRTVESRCKWEKGINYGATHAIVIHPDLCQQSDQIASDDGIYYFNKFYKIDRIRKLANDFITQPPVTIIGIELYTMIRNKEGSGFETISTAILKIQGGIRVRDVFDTYDAMHESGVECPNRNGPCWRHHLNVRYFRLIDPDLHLIMDDD